MKLRIFFKAFRQDLVKQGLEIICKSLENGDASITGAVIVPHIKKRFCVLTSPHVDKKSREHFEIRIYKQFFDIKIDSIEVFNSLAAAKLPSGLFCYFKIL